jgi:hypothetical protein
MKKYILSLVLIVATASSGVFATGVLNDDYKFHGMFVMNFLKYVQWQSSSPEIVVAILGDESVMPDMERATNGRQINGKRVVVRRFGKASELSPDCQAVYIPANKSGELSQVVQSVGSSALIITAKDGLIRKGSCINLIIKDGKWRFEISEEAAEKAHIKISNELSKLAI